MNAPDYNLDPQSARKGSGSAGSIDETGAYVGKITLAKHVIAGTGAAGIQLNFESDDGAKANYLNLYTHNKDGQPIFGMDHLNALMTCLKVRSLKPAQREVEEYDRDSQGMVKAQAQCYPDLENKPVGMILRKEWYVDQGGQDKYRMAMFAPFNAQSGQLAIEVLDDRPAEGKDKIAASLKDKGAPRGNAGAPPVGAYADVDGMDPSDDIPF